MKTKKKTKKDTDASDEDVELMKRYIDVYCVGRPEAEGSDVQTDAVKAMEAINAKMSDEMKGLLISCTNEDGVTAGGHIPVVSQTLLDLLFSILETRSRFEIHAISQAGHNNLICSDFVLVSPKRGGLFTPSYRKRIGFENISR